MYTLPAFFTRYSRKADAFFIVFVAHLSLDAVSLYDAENLKWSSNVRFLPHFLHKMLHFIQ